MADNFAESTAFLAELLRKLESEADPDKCDDLAAGIRRILAKRDHLRASLAIKEGPDQQNPYRFET